MDSVDFRNSDLSGINLTESFIGEAKFGELALLKGHRELVRSVSFSGNGRRLASGS